MFSGKTGKPVAVKATGAEIEFSAIAGDAYVIEKHGGKGKHTRGFTVSGVPATGARKLGPVQIGLFPGSLVL